MRRYLVGGAVGITIVFACLPCILRVLCPSLASLTSYHDDTVELCISRSFFGDGAFTVFFSVLVMIQSMQTSLPLNMFFISTILGALRHQKACRVYGKLARIDKMTTPVSKYPVLDMTVHTPINCACIFIYTGIYFAFLFLSFFSHISFFSLCEKYITFQDSQQYSSLDTIIVSFAFLWPTISQPCRHICKVMLHDFNMHAHMVVYLFT
jgi:hypothetical protein